MKCFVAEEQYNVFIAPLFFTTEELPIPDNCSANCCTPSDDLVKLATVLSAIRRPPLRKR